MGLVPRIIKTRDAGVPVGVIDKDMRFLADLREVTFADVFDAIHSVYAHREGPFQAVEDIITAHHNGTLHPYVDHQTAVEALKARGDHETAGKIAALIPSEQSTTNAKDGDV